MNSGGLGALDFDPHADEVEWTQKCELQNLGPERFPTKFQLVKCLSNHWQLEDMTISRKKSGNFVSVESSSAPTVRGKHLLPNMVKWVKSQKRLNN